MLSDGFCRRRDAHRLRGQRIGRRIHLRQRLLAARLRLQADLRPPPPASTTPSLLYHHPRVVSSFTRRYVAPHWKPPAHLCGPQAHASSRACRAGCNPPPPCHQRGHRDCGRGVVMHWYGGRSHFLPSHRQGSSNPRSMAPHTHTVYKCSVPRLLHLK